MTDQLGEIGQGLAFVQMLGTKDRHGLTNQLGDRSALPFGGTPERFVVRLQNGKRDRSHVVEDSDFGLWHQARIGVVGLVVDH